LSIIFPPQNKREKRESEREVRREMFKRYLIITSSQNWFKIIMLHKPLPFSRCRSKSKEGWWVCVFEQLYQGKSFYLDKCEKWKDEKKWKKKQEEMKEETRRNEKKGEEKRVGGVLLSSFTKVSLFTLINVRETWE
jgi:hypothetical protein